MDRSCYYRFVYVLFLSAILVSAVPDRLATGYLFPPRETPVPVQAAPPHLENPRPDPTARYWSMYSDITGDLACDRTLSTGRIADNGIVRNALELGYSNQLLEMEPNGKDGKNILLLGIDTRVNGRGRSDCIVVLRVVPGIGVLTLSIPRDVKVPMNPSNQYGYKDKIAHMYVYGGVERTRRSVEKLLGIHVDHYVVVKNLRDFNRLLSLIRGVDVDKHLEGELGLKWIRNRSFASGDLERSMRAQVFIKAVIEKTWRLTDGADRRLTGLLARAALLFVDTDLNVAHILELADGLKAGGFEPSTQVYTGHLNGRPTYSYSPVLDLDLAFIEPERKQLKHFSRVFTCRGEWATDVCKK